MKTKLIAIIACASLIGCASLQNIPAILGTPEQVQSELTILGGVAKAHISADAQAKIHNFAVQLNSAANLDLTALFALIPSTGSINGDALIGAVKAYLTATVQKYGSNNGTTLAYAHAVANALLAVFTNGQANLRYVERVGDFAGSGEAFIKLSKQFSDQLPIVTTSSRTF